MENINIFRNFGEEVRLKLYKNKVFLWNLKCHHVIVHLAGQLLQFVSLAWIGQCKRCCQGPTGTNQRSHPRLNHPNVHIFGGHWSEQGLKARHYPGCGAANHLIQLRWTLLLVQRGLGHLLGHRMAQLEDGNTMLQQVSRQLFDPLISVEGLCYK